MSDEPIALWQVRQFPWTVRTAGIIWFGVGGLNLVGSSFAFAYRVVQGTEDIGGTIIYFVLLGYFLCAAILAFAGTLTLQGSIRHVKVAGTLSILFSLLFYLDLLLGSIHAFCFMVQGFLLTLAGFLAFFGAESYVLWRHSQEESERFLNSQRGPRERWKWD